ncbi:MAG: hypothetical protein K8I29_17010 [Alphaproteobacteria bacterium]|uniref:Uncharacterized protein n=1 Tax=Candidatus Nitrobium versatile TaxID=2884831 RepID=A0A953M2R9_9BACT|nr:hypothetical protein [Candidatus Nitrobium versatile]
MKNSGTVRRNYKAIVSDIAEGFLTINPLYLKPYEESALKSLYTALERKQVDIRAEPFPYHDTSLIRQRNLKLQRIFAAITVMKSFSREKRFRLL